MPSHTLDLYLQQLLVREETKLLPTKSKWSDCYLRHNLSQRGAIQDQKLKRKMSLDTRGVFNADLR